MYLYVPMRFVFMIDRNSLITTVTVTYLITTCLIIEQYRLYIITSECSIVIDILFEFL